MTRATAEERALARAALYRLLALCFSYPTRDVVAALPGAIEVAEFAAPLLDPSLGDPVRKVGAAFARMDGAEAVYQRAFTLSYNEDCPPYETAFSARHIFQQTQHQADLSGFYRAFGVETHRERSDHLSVELEFGYLLAVKEARARDRKEREHVQICRDAHRKFVAQHLARWAPLIGQRVAVTASTTPYASAGSLLVAFMAWEEQFLRLGKVDRYRNEPMMIADDPGEFTCPMAGDAATTLFEMVATGKGADDGG